MNFKKIPKKDLEKAIKELKEELIRKDQRVQDLESTIWGLSKEMRSLRAENKKLDEQVENWTCYHYTDVPIERHLEELKELEEKYKKKLKQLKKKEEKKRKNVQQFIIDYLQGKDNWVLSERVEEEDGFIERLEDVDSDEDLPYTY